jgi:hypothetical protein
MKYEKTIEQIKSGTLTRDALRTIRERAAGALAHGDEDTGPFSRRSTTRWRATGAWASARTGELANLVDGRWRAEGICTFNYDESEVQMNQFRSIVAGGLIFLKKSEVHGKLMTLHGHGHGHGHGRVTGTRTGADGRRELLLDWSQAAPFPRERADDGMPRGR